MWVTSRIKKRLNSPAGHAGTLDPLASGLLPIALGKATKTLPFLLAQPKTYRVEVFWGEERTTHDILGVLSHTTGRLPQPEAVKAALDSFVGNHFQRPPRFCALKINGQRAYALARKGKKVFLEPRKVILYKACVLKSFERKSVLELVCGKGFYVRALVRDLGRALGVGAYVAALRRTRVGPFVEGRFVEEDTKKLLAAVRPFVDVLGALSRISLSWEQTHRVRQGQKLPFFAPDGQKLALYKDTPVALVQLADGVLHPKRVFATQEL